MNTINRTSLFDDWLGKLKDIRAKVRIVTRIRAAEIGNWGDCAPVGEGISEMRIHVGSGYRVYYVREGRTVYLLLIGGDKSTQAKDIVRAKAIWSELKESLHD